MKNVDKGQKGRLDFIFQKKTEDNGGEDMKQEEGGEKQEEDEMSNVAQESKEGDLSEESMKFLKDKAKEGKAVFVDGLDGDDWLRQGRETKKANYPNRNAHRKKEDEGKKGQEPEDQGNH